MCGGPRSLPRRHGITAMNQGSLPQCEEVISGSPTLALSDVVSPDSTDGTGHLPSRSPYSGLVERGHHWSRTSGASDLVLRYSIIMQPAAVPCSGYGSPWLHILVTDEGRLQLTLNMATRAPSTWYTTSLRG